MYHSKVSLSVTRISKSAESFRQQTQPYICHSSSSIQIRKLISTATSQMISEWNIFSALINELTLFLPSQARIFAEIRWQIWSSGWLWGPQANGFAIGWVSLGFFVRIFIKIWRLGMDKGESTAEDIEKLKKMVPKAYQKYIESEFSMEFPLNSFKIKLPPHSVRQRIFKWDSTRERLDRGGLDDGSELTKLLARLHPLRESGVCGRRDDWRWNLIHLIHSN